MSDPRHVAKTLRDVSQEGGDPAARRAAMLHFLRKEFDHLPVDDAIAAIFQVRAEVAPGDRGSEASHLWECMSGALPLPGPDAPRSAPASTGVLENQARDVLGGQAVPAAGFSPEMAERWMAIVKIVLVSLFRYEAEFQRLYRDLKRESTPSTDMTTSLGIRLERPMQTVLSEILDGRRDIGELEGRLKRFAQAAWLMYNAHVASATHSRESLKKLLDPNKIQSSAAGKDYWGHYRQLYRQELYDFGPVFTQIFVENHFLTTLLKALKNT